MLQIAASTLESYRETPVLHNLDSRKMLYRAKEMVILGTQYAGEMKKGIFTVMHYLMPKRGILSLHSGCNVGKDEDVTLFFGLSGVAVVTVTCKLLVSCLSQGRQLYVRFLSMAWHCSE